MENEESQFIDNLLAELDTLRADILNYCSLTRCPECDFSKHKKLCSYAHNLICLLDGYALGCNDPNIRHRIDDYIRTKYPNFYASIPC